MFQKLSKSDALAYGVHAHLDEIAEIAGLKNAGLESDGRNRKGGHCRTGK